jgi:arabinogalactan oligomer/maltooligosaccharide transport system substrate-binding protein
MNRIRLIPILVAVLCALPATVPAKTAITVWHAYRGKERDALQKVVANFNTRSPDIEVKLLPIPYDAFADKITFAIPGGKGPDLFIFAQDRLGDWAASGHIESVDFWVDDSLREKYLPPTIEALTYDDQLYGLPIAFKMVALFYNKKLVKTPPSTTDEMIKLGKTLTKPAAQQFGLVYENANFYFHAPWMHGFGGHVFDNKGRPTLDSDEVIQSMKVAQFLAHDAGIMPEEVSNTLVTSLFNKNKAGMVISGPWFMGEIDKSVNYSVSLLPIISKTGKRATPYLTVEAVMMSARTKDKKAAFQVMQYLTGPEAGVVMATEGRQTPAQREVYGNPAVKNDPILSVFKEQLANTIPMPNTPVMRKVWDPATKAMNKIINGNLDPAQVMHAAQGELKKLLQGTQR